MLSAISKTEKDIPYDLSYIWSLNKQTHMHKKLIDLEIDVCQRWG